MATFILELDEAELKVIGRALHTLRRDGDSNELVDRALSHLREQTNCVHADPKSHGVFEKGEVFNPYAGAPMWVGGTIQV